MSAGLRWTPWAFWVLTVGMFLAAEPRALSAELGLILGGAALVGRTPALAERGWAFGFIGLAAAATAVALEPVHALLVVPALLGWSALLAALMQLRARALRELGAWSSMRARLAADVSLVFGAGLARPGPGTVGALAALILGPGLISLSPIARGAALVVATALAIVATRDYLRYARSSDPSEVVVDEILGCAIALAVLPAWSLSWAIGCFIAFRVFDIAKPWPVRTIDRRLKGAHGVVLDDVAAGLMAAAVIAALRIAL